MGSGVTAADTQGALEKPHEADFAKGDCRTTVPQAHAIWNTTPLSLVGIGKSSSDTASPVSAWNHT